MRASVLEGLDPLVRSRGGPPLAELLDEIGIEPERATNSNDDISLEKFALLLDRAGRRVGEDCFGLELAEVFPIGGSGVLGYLLLNAPDFRTFAVSLSRYTPLQVDALTVGYSELPGAGSLTWTLPEEFLGPRRQLIEFSMATTIKRIQHLFGRGWSPARLQFEYRAPAVIDRYQTHFGPALLEFETGVNRLSFRADMLSLPNRMPYDGRLFETLEGVARSQLEAIAHARELKGAERRDLLSRLRAYFVDHLDTGQVDLEHTARALRLTPRELQAELRWRDTSFGQELTRARQDLAERYLRETSLPMSEIAFLLGFSELSAFTRAARGWFRKPPSAVRHEAHQS